MPRHRHELPQSRGSPFLTDGGIETTLIFHYGLELPSFAAFTLLDTSAGQAALNRYFSTYADLARRLRLGLVLESPTWRASPDWATPLGYSSDRPADPPGEGRVRALPPMRCPAQWPRRTKDCECL